jgi:hypothetical protein
MTYAGIIEKGKMSYMGSSPFNRGWRYARSKKEYGTDGKDGTDGISSGFFRLFRLFRLFRILSFPS